MSKPNVIVIEETFSSLRRDASPLIEAKKSFGDVEWFPAQKKYDRVGHAMIAISKFECTKNETLNAVITPTQHGKFSVMISYSENK